MLWNWNTVNACFISSTWHVRSKGGFAGSCIGVIFLVVLLEGLKRLQRGYDRGIVKKQREKLARGNSSTREEDKEDEADIGKDHQRQRRDRRTGSEPGLPSSVSSCCQPSVTPNDKTIATTPISTPTIPILSSIIHSPSRHPRTRLTLVQQSIRALIPPVNSPWPTSSCFSPCTSTGISSSASSSELTSGTLCSVGMSSIMPGE